MSGKSNIDFSGTMSATLGAGTQSGSASIKSKYSHDDTVVDLVSSAEGTIAPAGSVTFTFDDASMTDQLGAAATFASVQSIAIENTGANALQVSGAIAGGLDCDIPPGGSLGIDFGTAPVTGTGATVVIGSTGGSDYKFIAQGLV